MSYSLDALLYGMQFRRLLEKKLSPLEEEYGLHKIDLQLIYYLSHEKDRNTSSDMMAMQMFTRGHISQALTHLQKKGYIRIEQDMQDRRCTHNLLTASAQELADKTAAVFDAVHQAVLKNINDKELQVLQTVAQKIYQNIQDE